MNDITLLKIHLDQIRGELVSSDVVMYCLAKLKFKCNALLFLLKYMCGLDQLCLALFSQSSSSFCYRSVLLLCQSDSTVKGQQYFGLFVV